MRDRWRVYDDTDRCVLETVDVEAVKRQLSRMRNSGVTRALVQYIVAGAPVRRVEA